MKRLLALLLACLMMFSLVACGNNSDKPDAPTDGGAIEQPVDKPDDTKPSEESTTPDSEDTTEPSEEPTDTIRENGQFPEDKNDLTEVELEYINGDLYDKIVKAVIELDMDVLREYTSSQYLYGFERINENEKFRTMYLNTIGKSIYLPESRYIVKVDTQYVFAKWHTGLLLQTVLYLHRLQILLMNRLILFMRIFTRMHLLSCMSYTQIASTWMRVM